MNLEKVRRVQRASSRKDKFRERERYRRSFWGTVFLELVLQKIEEEEFFDIEYPAEEDAAGAPKRRASISRVIHTEVRKTQREIETQRERESGHGWMLPAKRESVRTEKESILVWASGDWLEISRLPVEIPDISEEYSALANFMRCIEVFSNNRIFYDSYEILQKYYDGAVEKFYVERAFYRYCRSYLTEKIEENPFRVYDALSEIYEYFERANTRNAVRKNNEEGRRLAEESGITWTGSSYYNADYYYKCRELGQMFRRICEELSREYDMDVPDFDEIEKNTRFRVDGGLTFHGVWVWAQQQNNYPSEEYGMRELYAMPPEGFLYFYRDYFNDGQYRTFERLKGRIWELVSQNPSDEQEFYSFTIEEKDYHNGLSYLLEQKLTPENWNFLANFKLHRTAGCMEILCGLDR